MFVELGEKDCSRLRSLNVWCWILDTMARDTLMKAKQWLKEGTSHCLWVWTTTTAGEWGLDPKWILVEEEEPSGVVDWMYTIILGADSYRGAPAEAESVWHLWKAEPLPPGSRWLTERAVCCCNDGNRTKTHLGLFAPLARKSLCPPSLLCSQRENTLSGWDHLWEEEEQAQRRESSRETLFSCVSTCRNWDWDWKQRDVATVSTTLTLFISFLFIHASLHIFVPSQKHGDVAICWWMLLLCKLKI